MAVGFPTKTTYANGDVYSASDVNDTNGTINLLQTSTQSRMAGKNPVINGATEIWARGTSVAVAASTPSYTADRWYYSNGANQASVISRQVTGDTTNLPNIQYCARVQRNSGQTGTGNTYFAQSFESVNSIPFTGQAVTLSFYARKGANYSATSNILTVYFNYGTGTDQNVISGYTGGANVVAQNATLTATWQRFTYTGTVPTTATELGLFFQTVPTGTAGTNDYYEVTGVQVELGSYATTFSRAGGTIQGELAACQRYYQLIASGNLKNVCNVGAYTSTSVYGTYFLKVSMRTAPTISVITGTDYYAVTGNNASDGTTTIGLGNASENQVRLEVTSGISVTQGYSYWIDTTSASAFLAVQAEL
jgi:hypothetical protein